MTAAKRKAGSPTKAKRDPFDDYPTPRWAVHRLLDANILPMHGHWLEPFAGAGNVIGATRAWCEQHRLAAPRIGAFEIQERYRPALDALCAEDFWIGDAMARLEDVRRNDGEPRPYDVLITNPPYEVAFEAVRLATQVAKTGALLLRNDFLGSEERSAWLREHVPTQACIPNRPSFRDAVRERWRCTDCSYELIWELDEATAHCGGCGNALDLDGTVPRAASFLGLKVTGSDSAEYSWFIWDERSGRRGSLLILDSTPGDVRSLEIAERRALLLPELAKTRPYIGTWLDKKTARGVASLGIMEDQADGAR